MNYISNTNSPKFFPGTDIRTNDSYPDSILVKSNTINLLTSTLTYQFTKLN